MTYIEHLITMLSTEQPKIARMPPREQLGVLYMTLRNAVEVLVANDDKEHIHNIGISYDVVSEIIRGRSDFYKVGSQFGKHLDRTNLDVPCRLLPVEASEAYYVGFPDGMVFKSQPNDYHRNCLASVQLSKDGTTRSLAMLFPDMTSDGRYKESGTYVVLPLTPDLTIGECIDKLNEQNFEISEGTKRLVAFVAKSILYIKSGDPDLQREMGKWSTSKKLKKIKGANRENCRFDTIKVGYGFHGKTFNVDETMVSGHFRWQPYGPDRGLIKLIWIDEHVRTFDTTGQ